jgi:hypothetical protein
MTTPKIQMTTGIFIAALRDLQMALCDARPDGPALAQAFAEGRTRVVVNEPDHVIELLIVDTDGRPAWVESIITDYNRPHTWGELSSLGMAATTTHH